MERSDSSDEADAKWFVAAKVVHAESESSDEPDGWFQGEDQDVGVGSKEPGANDKPLPSLAVQLEMELRSNPPEPHLISKKRAKAK